MKLDWRSRSPPMFSSTVISLLPKPRATRRRATSGMVVRSAVSTSRRTSGLDEGFDVGGVAAVQRERVAVGQRPAHAGGGEREGGEVRDDLHLGEGDELHQLAGHAVIHRVAGGEDHGAAAAQRRDAVDHRGEGLRPFVDLGRASRGRKPRRRGGADDGLGTLDGEPGAGREALPAVLAHADDGEPLAHCGTSRQGVDDGGRHGRAAAAAEQRGIGNAARVGVEFVLRFRGADEAHRESRRWRRASARRHRSSRAARRGRWAHCR